MADLILRAELQTWLQAKIRECVMLNAYSELAITNEINNYVKAMPAVDAVPVVRCKDCKNSDAWYGDKRICRLWNDKDGHDVFEDGFCSYGERRDDE